MSDYTREDYEDIFRGSGLDVHIQEGWLDLDLVAEPHLYPALVAVYDAWDAYKRAVHEANRMAEGYFSHDF